MVDAIMEEHSLRDQRSTNQSPGCGEDVRTEAAHEQRLWDGRARVGMGMSFPIQFGYTELLCKVEIQIQVPLSPSSTEEKANVSL